MANIFVSFNFQDKQLAKSLKGWCCGNDYTISHRFIFVESDVSSLGDDAIDWEIKRVMMQCSYALFVVGDNSHNSPWINREAALANSRGMKILIAQLPNTRGGTPYVLRNCRNVINVDWSPRSINSAINGF